jgi:hypothetical protein
MKGKKLEIGMYIVITRTTKRCPFPANRGTPLRVTAMEYPFVVVSWEYEENRLSIGPMGLTPVASGTRVTKTETFDVRGCRFQRVPEGYVAALQAKPAGKEPDWLREED